MVKVKDIREVMTRKTSADSEEALPIRFAGVLSRRIVRQVSTSGTLVHGLDVRHTKQTYKVNLKFVRMFLKKANTNHHRDVPQ